MAWRILVYRFHRSCMAGTLERGGPPTGYPHAAESGGQDTECQSAICRYRALGFHVCLCVGSFASRVCALQRGAVSGAPFRLFPASYRKGSMDSAARLGGRVLRLGMALGPLA